MSLKCKNPLEDQTNNSGLFGLISMRVAMTAVIIRDRTDSFHSYVPLVCNFSYKNLCHSSIQNTRSLIHIHQMAFNHLPKLRYLWAPIISFYLFCNFSSKSQIWNWSSRQSECSYFNIIILFLSPFVACLVLFCASLVYVTSSSCRSSVPVT